MTAGSGGSIPIVSALAGALPDTEALLVGATDGYANILGSNERVLLDEFETAIVAEAVFLRTLRGCVVVNLMLDGIETIGKPGDHQRGDVGVR